ncbi:MAG: hypothetical protein AMK72_08340 [Planctomycetes bacterium SM23_25]|nr:MAG: hypothetical protein AMK72_08340 [Planctomycetes bacterium SM23_25]
MATAGCAGVESVDNSQAGWRIQSDTIDLFVTRNGAHMAPVRFCTNTAEPVQPYYISPWQNEGLKHLPDPVLVPLRGDFFCMPFGANAEAVGGEKHTGHGEPSSARWRFVGVQRDGKVKTLTLDLHTKVRRGRITKKIHLVDGQNVVYTSHVIEGYTGGMPIGHHCTLAVPAEEGSLRIAVSPFEMGMTCPVVFSNPVNREYQSLAINKTFTDLTKVPVLAGEAPLADCSSFPQRTGFTDLIQIFKKPSAEPAWTAATCQKDGYLWFSLKDASRMPGTVFWISNRGRHGFPWNGRNRCLGLEETCSYFAEGLGPSTGANVVTKQGFPTAVQLSPTRPTVVNFIQGAVKIPAGFENVRTVRFGKDAVTFVSVTGKEITVEVNHAFIRAGKL